MEQKTCLTIGRNVFWGAFITVKVSKKHNLYALYPTIKFLLSLYYPKFFRSFSLILNFSDTSHYARGILQREECDLEQQLSVSVNVYVFVFFVCKVIPGESDSYSRGP